MIAMQYRFTLPADYDMEIIDRRIRDKGPLLDTLPHLFFKAYLSARQADAEAAGDENLYAPFYLWETEEALSDFLCSPAFVALTQAFGWPQVKSWIVWSKATSEHIGAARFATREITAIAPHATLADTRRDAAEATQGDIRHRGALASVTGFEPMGWTRLRFRLWRDLPEPAVPSGAEVYRVGHLSLPGTI